MFSDIMKARNDVETLGMTFSTFDLLHAGHIAMLEEAKDSCDLLVCGLQTDPTIDRPEKNKPIQNVFERWMQLSAVRYVDYIIPYDTEQSLIDILAIVKPDVRILGEEYRFEEYTGKDMFGIKAVYNQRDHAMSTSDLRNRVVRGSNLDSIISLGDFKARSDEDDDGCYERWSRVLHHESITRWHGLDSSTPLRGTLHSRSSVEIWSNANCVPRY